MSQDGVSNEAADNFVPRASDAILSPKHLDLLVLGQAIANKEGKIDLVDKVDEVDQDLGKNEENGENGERLQLSLVTEARIAEGQDETTALSDVKMVGEAGDNDEICMEESVDNNKEGELQQEKEDQLKEEDQLQQEHELEKVKEKETEKEKKKEKEIEKEQEPLDSQQNLLDQNNQDVKTDNVLAPLDTKVTDFITRESSERVEALSDDDIDVPNTPDDSNSDSESGFDSESSCLSSESEDSSDESSDSETESVVNTNNKHVEESADDEEETSTGPIVSKNEVFDEKAPSLPEDYIVPQDAPLEYVGDITSLVEKSVIIKANVSGEFRVLNDSSILCFEDRTVLGPLFETFGRLQAPYYRVKFNKDEDFANFVSKKGHKVYYVVPESQFLYTDTIKSYKGTDASNCHDEELPEDEQEFSDDEQEQAAKQAKKKKRLNKKAKDGLVDLSSSNQSNKKRQLKLELDINRDPPSKYRAYGYPDINDHAKYNSNASNIINTQSIHRVNNNQVNSQHVHQKMLQFQHQTMNNNQVSNFTPMQQFAPNQQTPYLLQPTNPSFPGFTGSQTHINYNQNYMNLANTYNNSFVNQGCPVPGPVNQTYQQTTQANQLQQLQLLLANQLRNDQQQQQQQQQLQQQQHQTAHPFYKGSGYYKPPQ